MQKMNANLLVNEGLALNVKSKLPIKIPVELNGSATISSGNSYVNRVTSRDQNSVNMIREKLKYYVVNGQLIAKKSFTNDTLTLATSLWKDFNADEQFNYPLFKMQIANSFNISENFSVFGAASYHSSYYMYQDQTAGNKIEDNFNIDILFTQYFFKRHLEANYEFFSIITPYAKEYPTGADILRRFNFRLTYRL